MFAKSVVLASSVIALCGFSLWSSVEDLNKQHVLSNTQEHGFYIPEESRPMAGFSNQMETDVKPVNATQNPNNQELKTQPQKGDA